jgi:hypothetical protein
VGAMQKQQILERLGEIPENSSIWNGIGATIAEYEELVGLQRLLYDGDSLEAHSDSKRAERLRELERKFGI